MKYYAYNKYFINGTTVHRTAKAALKEANLREGDGWMVKDEEGNIWTLDWDGNPCISEHANL